MIRFTHEQFQIAQIISERSNLVLSVSQILANWYSCFFLACGRIDKNVYQVFADEDLPIHDVGFSVQEVESYRNLWDI